MFRAFIVIATVVSVTCIVLAVALAEDDAPKADAPQDFQIYGVQQVWRVPWMQQRRPPADYQEFRTLHWIECLVRSRNVVYVLDTGRIRWVEPEKYVAGTDAGMVEPPPILNRAGAIGRAAGPPKRTAYPGLTVTDAMRLKIHASIHHWIKIRTESE